MKIVFTLLLTILLVSCTRSEQYERDLRFSEMERSPSEVQMANSQNEKLLQGYDLKKKVYILGFTNETEIGGDELSFFARDEFDRQFRFSKKTFVPDDVDLKDNPANFFSDGKIKTGQLVSKARKFGLQAILLGKIKKVSFRSSGEDIGLIRKNKSIALATLEIYLVDVQTGKVIFSETRTGDSKSNTYHLFRSNDSEDGESKSELVQEAIRSVVQNIILPIRRSVDKISWEGKIAKIHANKIYLNAGRSSGLNVGDILKVITQGEDIFDPETGAFLGRSKGVLKGTLEVQDFLGMDGAVCSIHSGGNFDENDIIQLY